MSFKMKTREVVGGARKAENNNKMTSVPSAGNYQKRQNNLPV